MRLILLLSLLGWCALWLAATALVAPRANPEAAQAQHRCPPWLMATTEGTCR